MIPVIVVSANVAERAKREAILLGAHAFIEKPYDFRKLVAAIDRAASTQLPDPAIDRAASTQLPDPADAVAAP